VTGFIQRIVKNFERIIKVKTHEKVLDIESDNDWHCGRIVFQSGCDAVVELAGARIVRRSGDHLLAGPGIADPLKDPLLRIWPQRSPRRARSPETFLEKAV